MSERAVLVRGFAALPDGWPERQRFRDDRALISDGQHFIGSRARPGGRELIVTLPGGTRRALEYHGLAMANEDVTELGIFVVDRDGLGLAESDYVPAPFDRFTVGGERLPDLTEA